MLARVADGARVWGYEGEMFGLSEGTVLLTQTSGLRVSVIDGAPFPEPVFRCRSVNMELCVQQIDEVVAAVGILLAEPSQPQDVTIRLPGDEQLGHQGLTETTRGLS